MFKAAIKSLLHHKTRLALTALSIVLGVAFISGTFIYTDTTSEAFDGIFDTAFEGIDVIVTSDSPFSFSQGVYFDEEIVDDVAGVPGVARSTATLQGFGVTIVGKDGEIVGASGPPKFAAFIPPDPQDWGPVTFREGVPPEGPDQAALDISSAELGDYAIGDTIVVVSPTEGSMEFTLVGTTGFGELDNLGGATFALFDLPTTQMVLDQPGKVDGVQVQAEPGTDIDQLVLEIQAILPSGAIAQSAQTAAEEQAAEIQQGLGFFSTFLLVFAFVALFVGTFIIYNTFRIVVVQRLRELALMRAIGSTRSQTLRIVLLEAFIVGLVSSAIGIVVGIGLAFLLRAALEGFGIALPSGSLVLAPRTIIVGMLVGVGITVLSSLLPAVQASRIPPIAAMSEGYTTPTRRSFTVRAVSGTVITLLGIAILLTGLLGDIPDTAARLTTIGLGAVVIILGAYVLSAIFAIPASQIIGAPFAWLFGASGKLAQRNAGRDPRRISATSAAIMVGIALITLVSVLAASISGTIDDVLDTGIEADLTVLPQNTFDISAGFSPDVAAGIDALPEVAATAQVQQGPAIVSTVAADGTSSEEETFITGVSDNALSFFDVFAVEGDAIPSQSGIVVDVGTAEDNGWTVGTDIEVLFEATGPAVLTLEGIVDGSFADGYTLSREGFVRAFESEADAQVLVQLAEGVTIEEGRSAVETVTADVPTIQVQTLDEFQSDISDQINQLLGLFTGLLALTVLIALIGVTNTMTLAVYERTREIGLLRAVGLDRGQTRRMILTEASIIASFGATLGVILGVGFAWAILNALRDEGFTTFVIPIISVIFWVAATALAAVVFALWPARRAARLNVLEAIAYE
ncbi:MAG: FtsX-like permease family protein [Acidimicrobiia bacterium]|nr:FtsX-like permease family protein [Acidimicrobiia bacterium]